MIVALLIIQTVLLGALVYKSYKPQKSVIRGRDREKIEWLESPEHKVKKEAVIPVSEFEEYLGIRSPKNK
jgi:hypothetical protein